MRAAPTNRSPLGFQVLIAIVSSTEDGDKQSRHTKKPSNRPALQIYKPPALCSKNFGSKRLYCVQEGKLSKYDLVNSQLEAKRQELPSEFYENGAVRGECYFQ
ncbi:hypothetical protein NECAME_00355 [Necator americanus]|uniref:Uncharacterized protein n=1 Tax=Necator americanus TaxID=51031 RepID=W2TD90_NECAM|nr:hypothetical protein NECAME_00355 [Necator americanus]ETN78982.1 hypothetical protein NECAME_00355 [Necator americanus]